MNIKIHFYFPKCFAFTSQTLTLESRNDAYYEIFFHQLHIDRLEILLCSLDIKSDFFHSLGIEFKSIKINGAESLILHLRFVQRSPLLR